MLGSIAAAGSRADRRRVIATRNAIKLAAELADEAGDGKDALILNISATGVLLQTGRKLAVGETVRIDLATAGRHAAKVMWTIDGMVGCQFLDPLAKSTLSAALLKGDALSQQPRDGINLPSDTGRSASEKLELGMAIALARKVKGMRQGDLARSIGVSTTTVCKWEQGHVRPRAKALAKLEVCLGSLDQRRASVEELPIPTDETSEMESSSVLHQCKQKIAKALGVRPEAINWQLQVTV